MIANLIATALQSSAALAPTSQWQVAPVGYSCSLARTFWSADNGLLLQVRPSDEGTGYDLYLIGKRTAVPAVDRGSRSRVEIAGGPANDAFGYTEDTIDGRRLFRTTVSRAFVDGIASGDELTVSDGKLSAVLHASGFANALRTLKTCHGDALRRLGLDPAPWFEDRTARLNNPGRFFGNDSRPKGMSAYGRVVMLLNFDATGKVTSCKPVAAPASQLGFATCSIAEARITARPATDDQGRPVAGYAFLPVEWRSAP